MVVGQRSKSKVAFIIQARMKSTRLPGKILLPLPFNTGKPIVKWIVDELRLSKFEGDIIIATSENAENDILFDYCQLHSITCFRGDEENVLSRFTTIISQNTVDIVVRLTADNPLIDISLLDKTIEYHIANNHDYTATEGLPLGMNFEIISAHALLALVNADTSDYDKEHVTPFIKNDDSLKRGIFKVESILKLKEIRVTVDYPEDYLLLSSILNFSTDSNLKGIKLIEKIYSTFPLIFQANKFSGQKQKYNSVNEEVKAACTLLETLELNQAAAMLKSCLT